MRSRTVASLLLVAALTAVYAVAGCGSGTPSAVVTVTVTPSPSPWPIIPTVERTRMGSLLSPYAYVPTSLPHGYIYIDWKHTPLSPSVAGELLTIEFAAPGGRQVVWTSSRAVAPNGSLGPSATGYPGYGYGMAVSRSAYINGVHVFFSAGNQGSNAWATFTIHPSGGTDYVAVGIWESNALTPMQAMQLVAHARPA